MLTLLKGSSVAAAGGVEDSVLTDTFLASRSFPFCSCWVEMRDSRVVDRLTIGTGCDSELPEVPLADCLVLPSFWGANWLSAGVCIGGGIFHAAMAAILEETKRLAGKSQQPEGDDGWLCVSGGTAES